MQRYQSGRSFRLLATENSDAQGALVWVIGLPARFQSTVGITLK